MLLSRYSSARRDRAEEVADLYRAALEHPGEAEPALRLGYAFGGIEQDPAHLGVRSENRSDQRAVTAADVRYGAEPAEVVLRG